MTGSRQRPTPFTLLMLLAFLLAGLPLAVAAPSPVLAQSGDSDIRDDEIVFINEDGFVRVLDIYQPAGSPAVQFTSPDDDWESVDLGDVNGDGDMEIIAVGGGDEDDDDDDGKLAIWDPAPAEGGDPIELYRRSIDGRARLVAAGNFDDNITGDEILFGYFLQDEAQAPGKDELMRISIIKGTSANPDGRDWTFHIERKDDGNEWNYVTVGNIDNAGPDEVALLDEEGGEVNLYRIDDGFNRIWGDSASDDPYRSVAFGDFYQGGFPELAVSRNMSLPGNLYVLRYDPDQDTMEGEYPGWNAFFQPYPRFLWAADFDGNNEDEVFFLRRDQDPRLVGLNYPPKNVILEADLEDDDFRVGVGGDFDADGREEIAIASSDRLLLYMEVETGNRTPIEYGFTTDRRSLKAGDLDAEGVIGAPTLGLSRIGGNSEVITSIDATLAAGESQQGAAGYYILNIGGDANISLDVSAPSQPAWLDYRLDFSVSGETDAGSILAAIYLSYDAAGLFPGDYAATLQIRDTNPLSEVSNNPLNIPVQLTVEPAALVAVPPSASFINTACATDQATRSLVVRLGGLDGLNFNAAIVEVPDIEAARAALSGQVVGARIAADGALYLLDDAGNESRLALPAKSWSNSLNEAGELQIDWPSDAPWVTASSETGVIPDLMTITVDPTVAAESLEEAALIMVADRRGGSPPANVHIVPIQYLCAVGQSHLPAILR